MPNSSPWALPRRTLNILLGLSETRFDLVCEYLAEHEGDDVHPHASREEAEALVSDLRAAVRWADVPRPIRRRLAATARDAERLWKVHGRPFPEVRRMVGITTPREHVRLVLLEAYRDASPDRYHELGLTDAAADRVFAEPEFEVAYVAEPPRALTPEEAEPVSHIENEAVHLREVSPGSGRCA